MSFMEEYGLIGKKLGHSFSADYFNGKFSAEGLPCRYTLFPIPSADCLPGLLKSRPDIKGLNVTIPYKSEVMRYLSNISSDAEAIGAVNVLKIAPGGLSGYNTDWIGFRDSLVPLLAPGMTRALVLGSGGASKAVVYGLQKLGIEPTVVSRSPEGNQIGYDGLSEEVIESHRIIVNTTPLGMFPDVGSYPPLPYHLLTSRHLCYDLVYNPEHTEFQKRASGTGASVKGGLEMLKRQADAAWEIWQS